MQRAAYILNLLPTCDGKNVSGWQINLQGYSRNDCSNDWTKYNSSEQMNRLTEMEREQTKV